MKAAVLSVVLAGLVMGARLERLRPDASASIWFEPNTGFVKGRTAFVGRTRGAYLYMTGSEVMYAMAPTAVERGAKMRQVLMQFEGASSMALGQGEAATGGYSNYFVGKTEREWFAGVPHFGRLRFREVYPGIDVVYYRAGGAIEYDFVVKPGADVSRVGMRFVGASSVTVGEDVMVSVNGAEMRVRRPRVFQGGVEIPSWYELEDGVVRVRMAGFDASQGRMIDPVLDFSTYLGGPGDDWLHEIVTAADGNPIVAGGTQSPASPTLDPFQQPSVVSAAPIIMKLSADGRRIIFYTVLGRNGWDSASGLVLGNDQSIHVTGSTRSGSFPTRNAFQSEFRAAWDNGFVTKLTSDSRSLVYSSSLVSGYKSNRISWLLVSSKSFPESVA